MEKSTKLGACSKLCNREETVCVLMEISSTRCLISVVGDEESSIGSSADNRSSSVFSNGSQAVCLLKEEENEKKINLNSQSINYFDLLFFIPSSRTKVKVFQCREGNLLTCFSIGGAFSFSTNLLWKITFVLLRTRAEQSTKTTNRAFGERIESRHKVGVQTLHEIFMVRGNRCQI